MNNVRAFLKDSSWAIGSQAISMVTGVVMSFVLPKFISVEAFGYWHLFLLYAGYVGILHFGYGDGIYLRIGGLYFDKIEKDYWYPQIQIVTLFQFVMGMLVALFAYFFIKDDPTRQWIFYFLAIYVVIDNIYKLLSFVLMATDKMAFYSKTVIIDKVLMFISIVLILLCIKNINVLLIVGAYVLSHLVVLITTIKKYPKLFKIKPQFKKGTIVGIIGVCSSGIVLTFSNIMSTFITGSCRMIVERFWDIEVFAQLSFAIVVSSFLLIFISQISYVLFPFLRRLPEQSQGKVLERLTFLLTGASIYLFVFVFLLYAFVYYWLPEYHQALGYLILLSPICFYDLRTNLLFNTYFKNLNKIKLLLIINCSTVAVATLMSLVAIYFNSMSLISLAILVSLVFKASIMQLWLYKHYGIKQDSIFFYDLLFTASMFISYSLYGLIGSIICYIVLIIVLTLLSRKKMFDNIHQMMEIVKRG